MDPARLKYKNLFALLLSLGFREEASSEDASEPRIFVHDGTDTVLLFRDAPAEKVSPADILSTEVHLHANSIIDRPLESLLTAVSAKK